MEEPRELGPLERELYDLIRNKGLADPNILDAQVTGRIPASPTTWEQVLLRGQMTHMQAILLLARRLDERAAEDR